MAPHATDLVIGNNRRIPAIGKKIRSEVSSQLLIIKNWRINDRERMVIAQGKMTYRTNEWKIEDRAAIRGA